MRTTSDMELAASIEWDNLTPTLKSLYDSFQAFWLAYHMGAVDELAYSVDAQRAEVERLKRIEANFDAAEIDVTVRKVLDDLGWGDQCNP